MKQGKAQELLQGTVQSSGPGKDTASKEQRETTQRASSSLGLGGQPEKESPPKENIARKVSASNQPVLWPASPKELEKVSSAFIAQYLAQAKKQHNPFNLLLMVLKRIQSISSTLDIKVIQELCNQTSGLIEDNFKKSGHELPNFSQSLGSKTTSSQPQQETTKAKQEEASEPQVKPSGAQVSKEKDSPTRPPRKASSNGIQVQSGSKNQSTEASSSSNRVRQATKNEEQVGVGGYKMDPIVPVMRPGYCRVDTLTSLDALEKKISENKNERIENELGMLIPVKSWKKSKKQLKREETIRFKPRIEQLDFLKISDLRDKYQVDYLTDYDKDLAAAASDILNCEVVGFDGEYRMGKIQAESACLPSYVQIATRKKAYVFNVELLAHNNRKAIEFLSQVCGSDKIKKVGHSVDEDIGRILKYFTKKFKVSQKIRLNTCSIEVELFTIKPPQTMGLSDISYRYLGKFMRKKEKSVRTGAKATLTNEVQMEYVALDALMPLSIYEKFKYVIDATIDPHPILSNNDYENKFFVDKGLKVLIKPLQDMGIDAIFLSGVSHREITSLCRKYPERILITHDKYLLLSADIPNKIPYYSNEQVFSQLNRISVELFSVSGESENEGNGD